MPLARRLTAEFVGTALLLSAVVGGLATKQMRRPWQTACKRAKLGARRFHDLRPSAVRNFVRAGIAIGLTPLLWKTRSMLDRYDIVSSGDLVDAARKQDTAIK